MSVNFDLESFHLKASTVQKLYLSIQFEFNLVTIQQCFFFKGKLHPAFTVVLGILKIKNGLRFLHTSPCSCKVEHGVMPTALRNFCIL